MSSERFFNRDLSLLAFHRRVLAQASDASFPLLERVRFVSIFSSNMDEFFMKRIGYLKRLHAKGAARAGADGAEELPVLSSGAGGPLREIREAVVVALRSKRSADRTARQAA